MCCVAVYDAGTGDGGNHSVNSELIDQSLSPSIGIVIGTYGAAPFIHLHLEIRKKFYPNTPIIIHDDASDEQNTLKKLCEQYNAHFISIPTRGGHYLGDYSAYVKGFEWALNHKLDALVKFSRRFIPLYDWTFELKRIFYSFPYPTVTSYDTGYGLGFCTECIAFSVAAWTTSIDGEPSAYEQISYLDEDCIGKCVEAYMHNHARKIFHHYINEKISVPFLDVKRLKRDMQMNPKHWEVEAYAHWHLAGHSRRELKYGALWYDPPEDANKRYEKLSHQLSLPYTASDFAKYNSRIGT